MKRYGAVFFFLLLLFFFWRGLSLEPSRLPSVQIGKPLPSITLPLLLKGQMNLSTLPRQVYLLNVFASWCSGCMEEQSLLLQLAEDGVLIYGLNYKDTQKKAKAWLLKWGNPYKAVLRDEQGLFAIELGVYGTPETFIIDKNGAIAYRYAGALNEEVIETMIKPKLLALGKGA